MPEHIYARLRRREWDAQMNREERLARQPPVYNAVPLNGQVLKGVFNGLAKAHPPRCVAIHERIKDPQAIPTPAPTGQHPGTNLPSSAVSPPGSSSCLNQTSHASAPASEFGTYMVGKKTFSVFMPKKPPPPAPFAQPVRPFTKGRFLRRVITLPENPSVTVLPQTVLSRAPGEDTYGAQEGRHHPFVYMGAAQDPTLGCMLQISDDVEGPSGFPRGVIKLGFHWPGYEGYGPNFPTESVVMPNTKKAARKVVLAVIEKLLAEFRKVVEENSLKIASTYCFWDISRRLNERGDLRVMGLMHAFDDTYQIVFNVAGKREASGWGMDEELKTAIAQSQS